jgi:hypothetical protein
MEQESITSFDKAVRLNQLLADLLTSNTYPDSSVLALMTCLNARFVHEAAEGYIILRKAGRDAAARQMLRPIVETVLWMAATEDQPDLLYRWVCTNYREEKKTILENVADKNTRSLIEKKFTQQSDDTRSFFEREHPGSTLSDEKLGLLSALKIAGERTGQNRERLYHEFYRPYCQYSHATLNAKAGDWNSMHRIEDDFIPFWGQSLALLSLKIHTGIQTAEDDVDAWIEDLQTSSRYKL